jgi:adenosine kinase
MFCYNLAATYWISKYSKEINEIIPYADIIIGNAEEAVALAAVKGWKTEDKMEIAKKIASEDKMNTGRPRIVVITQGHLETCACTYDFEKKKFDTFTISPTPIDRKDIVDTNGAGDCKIPSNKNL